MAKRRPARATPRSPAAEPSPLRIIGGKWKRQRILYSGDTRTRPMKDRVREAVFNLVGDDVQGALALDMFAGTGALGLEALSRGACEGVFIERHLPTARLLRKNIAALGCDVPAEVHSTTAFLWPTVVGEREAEIPWLVLCSPPFEFFVTRREEMVHLISDLWRSAPPRSVFVIESDGEFDVRTLPLATEWDVRSYPPARVGIARKAH